MLFLCPPWLEYELERFSLNSSYSFSLAAFFFSSILDFIGYHKNMGAEQDKGISSQAR